jgi:prophage regulatory protein
MTYQKTNIHKSESSKNQMNVEEIIASIDDSTKLLRLPAVEEIVGFKSTEIYKRIKEGTFPPPIKLGRRQAVWLSNQITDWKKRIVRENLGNNSL